MISTIRDKSAFLFLASTMVFPRSFLVVKLILLIGFFLVSTTSILKQRKLLLHGRILIFYLSIAGIGLTWSIIGLTNGWDLSAINDYLRLYVLWSILLCVVFHFLLMGDAFQVFHKSIVASGLVIPAMNFIALFSYVMQLGLVPEVVTRELDMRIGIHPGYIQMTAHNIGSLFFITAYLVAIQFRKDMNHLNGFIVKLSLFMCIVLVLLSGRRALWVTILLVPFLVVFLTIVTSGFNQLRGRRFLLYLLAGFCLAIVILFFLVSGENSISASFSHLQDAFSATDERSIQRSYLIDGFENYPIFGSGFGAIAGYQRSHESPWLYELTYHQMLFNFGLIGISLFIILLAIYFYYAIVFISQCNQNSGHAFSFIVAIVTFSIGAYSNPYFGSFDFILLLGVFPVIAASLNAKVPVLPGPTKYVNVAASGGGN